ncbi:MAG: hypothetical protein ACYC6Y_00025 [Thermoguttaceae bacterium]
MATCVTCDHARPGAPLVGAEFTGPQFNDDALNALVEEHPQLQWVQLRRNPVTDRGLSSLGRLEHLHSLCLDGLDVTDVGLEHALAPRTVTTLWLARLPVSGRAFDILGRQLQLRELTVVDTSFDVEDIDSLRGLHRLKILTLDKDCGLTGDQLARLQQALPDCRIELW